MFTASYISCPLSPATAYTNRHMSIHHHRGVAGSSAAPDLNNDTIPYYFDSDMSKSTNTVIYFDWKTVIYIYVCGKCRTQFMLPMEKSVAFTGACANEIIPSMLEL